MVTVVPGRVAVVVTVVGPDTVTGGVGGVLDVDVDDGGGGGELDEVALLPVAAAWNAANWLPGLIAKTMPC